jgi:hypothetical protein
MPSVRPLDHDVLRNKAISMLTEDQKRRIREEETFRQEVRRQLDAEKPSPSTREKTWGLINRPFTLWLLSTVVVGLLGWAYSNIQEHNKEQAHKKEIKRKVVNELSNRAIGSQFALLDARTKIDQRDPDSPRFLFLRISEMFDSKDITSKSNINSIYPEYQNRSFQSLITELDSVVSEEGKKYLGNAMEIYWELRISSKNAPEFQAGDNVEKKVEKSKKAIDTAGELMNGLMINLGRAGGAPPLPWLGKGK